MKLLIVVFAATCFGIEGNSQTFLIKAGGTNSLNTTEKSSSKIRPLIGVNFGVGYNYLISKKLALQLELNYTQKIFSSEFSSSYFQQVGAETYYTTEHQKDKYRVDYFEMPLLLKFSVNRFYFLAGPSIAYGIGGIHRYETDHTSSYFDPIHSSGKGRIRFGNYTSPSQNNDAYIHNRWDKGLQAGIGFVVFKNIQAECRYGVCTSGTNTAQVNLIMGISKQR